MPEVRGEGNRVQPSPVDHKKLIETFEARDLRRSRALLRSHKLDSSRMPKSTGIHQRS